MSLMHVGKCCLGWVNAIYVLKLAKNNKHDYCRCNLTLNLSLCPSHTTCM